MNYEDLTNTELKLLERKYSFKGFIRKTRLRRRQNKLDRDYTKRNIKMVKKAVRRYKYFRSIQVDLIIEKMSRELRGNAG